MTVQFPDAPDFNPQSQPWRRKAEETISSLQQSVEILTKNLRAYQRSTVAGTKATNLKISGLQGTLIRPNVPIGISVYPYAYFTASGYPAAGARIYWGDQNDVDHYEVWVGKVPIPGTEVFGDAPVAFVSQTATADVRGLECNTDYELAIRAISYGGSYGFFTATYPFTTPNETTQIGPYGYPNVSYVNGFGVVEWPYTDEYEPPYIDAGTVIGYELDGSGLGDGEMAPGVGVKGPDGKFYYPPTTDGNGLIIDPVARTYTYTDFGLGAPGFGGTGLEKLDHGVLGLDDRIYWVGGRYEGFAYLDVDTLTMTEVSIPSGAVSFGDLRGWSGIGMGSDGKIVAIPYPGTYQQDFLIIDSSLGGSTWTTDDLGINLPSGETWGRGVTDSNGEVWFMPGSGTNFIVVETPGIPTAQIVAMTTTWGADANLRGAILHSDGNVYAFALDGSDGVYYIIEPDGTQTAGTTDSTVGSMVETAEDAYGKIYGAGGINASSDSYFIFDPATLTASSYDLGSLQFCFRSALSDADGNVFFVCDTTFVPVSGTLSTDRFIIAEPYSYSYPEVFPTGDMPNYFKHMLVERQIAGTDLWSTIGAMPSTGFFTDPSVEVDVDYGYRLTPVSTAGITGIPSIEVGLST